jgi:hypothetical protein
MAAARFGSCVEGPAAAGDGRPCAALRYDELPRARGGRTGLAATLDSAAWGWATGSGLEEKTPACVQAVVGVLARRRGLRPARPARAVAALPGIATDCRTRRWSPTRRPAACRAWGWAGARAVVVDAPQPVPGTGLGRSSGRRPRAGGAPAQVARSRSPTSCTPPARRDAPGVVHTHASGIRSCAGAGAHRGDGPGRVLQPRPVPFDLSISDLTPRWGRGRSPAGRLDRAMSPPSWCARCPRGDHRRYLVPSFLCRFAEAGALERARPERLRLLFFAGEVFPTPQLRRCAPRCAGAAVKLFGPETNVCTYYRCPCGGVRRTHPHRRGCENLVTFVVDERAGSSTGRRGGHALGCRRQPERRLWGTGRERDHARPTRAACPGSPAAPATASSCCPAAATSSAAARPQDQDARYRVELGEIEAPWRRTRRCARRCRCPARPGAGHPSWLGGDARRASTDGARARALPRAAAGYMVPSASRCARSCRALDRQGGPQRLKQEWAEVATTAPTATGGGTAMGAVR